jgi:PleD family two-component response regulator
MTATLLVVEDSRYHRLASRHILSEAGFSVVEASDGEEALRQVWESHPDLIILDMLLPKLGGNKCCKLSGKTRRQAAFQ